MTRSIELILGLIGGFLGAVVALLFGISQSGLDASLWPLPGLVFLELITLGFLGAVAAAREAGSAHQAWAYVPWAAAGALAALVILGGFTIGLFLIPSALCFLGVGLLGTSRWGTRLPLAISLAALAAVAQSAALLLPLALSG